MFQELYKLRSMLHLNKCKYLVSIDNSNRVWFGTNSLSDFSNEEDFNQLIVKLINVEKNISKEEAIKVAKKEMPTILIYDFENLMKIERSEPEEPYGFGYTYQTNQNLFIAA